MPKKIALILGVGAKDGIGGALCDKAAGEGYHVVAVGRTEEKLNIVSEIIRKNGGSITPLVADLAKEQEIIKIFDKLDTMTETLSFVTYNAGNNFREETLKMDSKFFEEAWRICCFGGFIAGREAARRLSALGEGSILFTGATASLRSRPPFVAFASAKAGLRAVASGLAREFNPLGVHVAHVIIDGGINGDIIRGRAPERIKDAGENGMLLPQAIADNYWQIHLQHRSTWSFEIDLRPYKEVF